MFTGSKYERGRNIAEIAKDVRRDIAAAVKGGTLPAGVRTSVRISRYSMGQSLNIDITAAPGLPIFSRDYLRDERDEPHRASYGPWESPEAIAAREAIESIGNAYNESRSDLQNDYHCETFFLHVQFDGALRDADRARGLAELAAAEASAAEPIAPEGAMYLIDGCGPFSFDEVRPCDEDRKRLAGLALWKDCQIGGGGGAEVTILRVA
jgi:hypothetical protein